jgi:uncharacterized zinc-type alcohol dehydrogenase-like protein
VGRVAAVGPDVPRLTPGDVVAVGVIVGSCRRGDPCRREVEVYCLEGPTNTHDGLDRVDGGRTRGGLSEAMIADERFVHPVPPGLDLAGAAPLLCAGLAVWSPLRHWRAGPGTTVGVVGIGGLGHLAARMARSLGAHVVAFTTSPDKALDAHRLGGHEVVLSRDEGRMAARANRLDLILDTVSTTHPLDPYLRALRLDGTLVTLGIPDRLDPTPVVLAMGRRGGFGRG